jgi:pyridinium-3,5-bisthiocarboxylic acid mononucleotide nickel chelatase
MASASNSLIGVIDGRTAGASGDKFLGALLDLGASKSQLEKVAKAVTESLPGTKKIDITVSSVHRGEIAGKLVQVESKEEVDRRKGGVVASALEKSSRRLRLSDWATTFASSTMDTLISAESKVHGHSPLNIELEELGSADTLVDILGTAALIDEIGLSGPKWWSTPLSCGAGVSHFSGRDYPNPPPAVAEILRAHKMPISPSKIEQELTTPTGAAITVNLATHVSSSYPSIRPTKIGYGAGAKELSEAANIIRIVLGEESAPLHSHDDVVVLETNLDDVTGEILGHAMEQLLLAGARDVTVTPVYMKKNRPGHLFSVITDADKSEKLAQVMMDETGSLGVREIPVSRHITHRTVTRKAVNLNGARYAVRVKSALNTQGEILGEKVEFEDRRRLAKKGGSTVIEVGHQLSKSMNAQGGTRAGTKHRN